MTSKNACSIWIIFATLFVAMVSSSAASAVVLIVQDGFVSLFVDDNGIGDANPASGVIDLPAYVTSEGAIITDLRCEVAVGSFSAVARILPAQGASFEITNPSDDTPMPVRILCTESLTFSIYGPGFTQWLGDGLADDTTSGVLDIIQVDFDFWPMATPASVPQAGPCPDFGGPQPCQLVVGVVADFFSGFIGNSVSAELTTVIGGGDRIRITQLEYSIGGGPPVVPALSGSGVAVLIASLLGACRLVMSRRGLEAGS